MNNNRKWSYAGIAVFLIFTSILLRLFGFKKTHGLLYRPSGYGPGQNPEKGERMEEAVQIADTVRFINRAWSFYRAYCLSESLALWYLLRRKGIDAEFRLGVRTVLGPFESHAWVEYRGTVLNDLENINQIFHAFDFKPSWTGNRSS